MLALRTQWMDRDDERGLCCLFPIRSERADKSHRRRVPTAQRTRPGSAIFPEGVEMTSNAVRANAALPAVVPIQDRVSAFLSAVYGWMCAGLALTATTAWLVARSPT